MSERTRSLGIWGGRIGQTVGALVMAGGATLAAWGVGESVYALATQPDAVDYPKQSTSSPEYIRDSEANAQHLFDGVGRVASGVPIALAGFAINTIAYGYRREDEYAETENLPDMQGGSVDTTGAVDEI